MSLHEKRIAALAGLAGVLFPSTSDAVEISPGAGLSAGVTLFQKKLLFNFTAEAYVTAGWETHDWRYGFNGNCYPYPDMTAFGPMGAVSFVKGHPRFIVAAIGGTPPIRDSALGIGGEAGVVFGAAGEPGPSLHLGANVVYSGLAAAVRSEALQETSVTAGLRYLPPYGSWGEECVIPGRPLRDADGRRMHRECVPGWAKEAQDEADSVLAFLDLAQALLERDAPPSLVDAAIDAAADEIRHALLCAAEAGTMPALPGFQPRPRLRGREALDRLATESFHDGWINEGRAARDALRRWTEARGTARTALSIIARDEARHARLGRAVTRWAVERGGRIALA
jgi:hypothetical protein